ncbi:hypothetical protein [Rhizobium terrae]|uniref:hypothetical protein n=1 Tax=Rhizobium terrae TaxID=2171756 RepID=UPI000E3EBB33|nr:hypothetical protein [Rhizobium terrae]
MADTDVPMSGGPFTPPSTQQRTVLVSPPNARNGEQRRPTSLVAHPGDLQAIKDAATDSNPNLTLRWLTKPEFDKQFPNVEPLCAKFWDEASGTFKSTPDFYQSIPLNHLPGHARRAERIRLFNERVKTEGFGNETYIAQKQSPQQSEHFFESPWGQQYQARVYRNPTAAGRDAPRMMIIENGRHISINPATYPGVKDLDAAGLNDKYGPQGWFLKNKNFGDERADHLIARESISAVDAKLYKINPTLQSAHEEMPRDHTAFVKCVDGKWDELQIYRDSFLQDVDVPAKDADMLFYNPTSGKLLPAEHLHIKKANETDAEAYAKRVEILKNTYGLDDDLASAQAGRSNGNISAVLAMTKDEVGIHQLLPPTQFGKVRDTLTDRQIFPQNTGLNGYTGSCNSLYNLTADGLYPNRQQARLLDMQEGKEQLITDKFGNDRILSRPPGWVPPQVSAALPIRDFKGRDDRSAARVAGS